MPAPRIATVFPTPTFGVQSPGRGDAGRPGGGAGGLVGAPAAADDDPQAPSVVPMPMAAIVRSTAELPTARPMEVRKSRRAMLAFLLGIFLSTVHWLNDYKVSNVELAGSISPLIYMFCLNNHIGQGKDLRIPGKNSDSSLARGRRNSGAVAVIRVGRLSTRAFVGLRSAPVRVPPGPIGVR
jgi:hypothetical protein